ncbi:hypothetical protein [Pandoraea sp. NPDC087047]|uniref:hypothetical protein n=1 Tax=Pandoraea sp. NPDC087047 TaxID=3364390 RepID=UPI0038157FA9
MKNRPVREDYQRWLNTQAVKASGDARGDTCDTGRAAPAGDVLPDVPTALPFAGYVVWFHASMTYLDIRFDHNRFEIVTQQVPSAAEAFYFDRLDDAYGHATNVSEPCLILFSEGADAPVRVVG